MTLRNKLKVIHIAQTHSHPFAEDVKQFERTHNIDLNIFNRVAQSQFKVAQAIKQHSGCPVILEGLNFNLKSSDQTERFKKIFPKGLPEKFEELTANQKTALYDGGAYILFHLGEISSLSRSV